jgi:hypothetical protein
LSAGLMTIFLLFWRDLRALNEREKEGGGEREERERRERDGT